MDRSVYLPICLSIYLCSSRRCRNSLTCLFSVVFSCLTMLLRCSSHTGVIGLSIKMILLKDLTVAFWQWDLNSQISYCLWFCTRPDLENSFTCWTRVCLCIDLHDRLWFWENLQLKAFALASNRLWLHIIINRWKQIF